MTLRRAFTTRQPKNSSTSYSTSICQIQFRLILRIWLLTLLPQPTLKPQRMSPINTSPVQKFNLIDVFAGVGGLTLGFRDSSGFGNCAFSPRLLVDIDPEARDVAKRNFPDIQYLVGDIHSVSGSDLRQGAGLGPKETLHALIGGPPCQGFSWLGKRALDDE